ncbi:MAG TPA: hypothetical protein VFI66_05245, partial [Gemmatimonadales bacterium]|nr:hypothetical protein [Gemmatimonadales bacterium]
MMSPLHALWRKPYPARGSGPPIDDGHYTTVSGTVTFDTRNDRLDPTAGWLLRGRFAHSHSDDVKPEPGVPSSV